MSSSVCSSVSVRSYNKQLQRTVMDKVPRHIGQRAAAELRRYTLLSKSLRYRAVARSEGERNACV